jgi:hypothetical protein
MSYSEVLERVEAAALRANRPPGEITLVAVSKTRTVEEIQALYDLGHRDFGENRAQEMAAKSPELPEDIRWHFVGALQSNKARVVRSATHLLHSLDRISLAKAWAKGQGLAPPALVQVNTGREPQKSGVLPEDVLVVVDEVIAMGIDVRGLMAIPPMAEDPEQMRPHFRTLGELRDDVVGTHRGVTQLSMGMTDDFEVAIEEGASFIRVGRAIFGPRS